MRLLAFVELLLCREGVRIRVPESARCSIAQTASDGKTKLPLSDAIRFSISDMMMRGPRTTLTLLSIVLSIAFFVGFLTNASLAEFIIGRESETQTYYLIVSSVAIVVCGVTITNAMIMSATERFNEIGTLKCLGALDRHVVLIFLVEGLVLGFVGGSIGGLIGLVAGLLATSIQFGLARILLFPAINLIRMLMSGIGLSLALTGLSSIYPVYFAVHLSPTEAFRYEV